MDSIFDRDYDLLDYDDEDSASENAESSEDDVDIVLQGTPKHKLKLTRQRSAGDQGRQTESSEDEFEKQMNKELNDHVASLEAQRKSADADASSSRKGVHQESNRVGPDGQALYDEVYFDSDEEEMVEGKSKGMQVVLSNDELLYDPDMDDEDQRWVDSQRRRYQPVKRTHDLISKSEGKKQLKKMALPNSDAVLDCPACMTTLCLDCQRHDVYTHQYRAMFVSNCSVDFSEVLKYPKGKPNKKSRKKTRFVESVQEDQAQTENSAEFDNYHPVSCTECNTVVAMYDKDEIYHFFNVLSSYT